MIIQYFNDLLHELAFWITSSIPAAVYVCLNFFYPDFMRPYWWVAIVFILLGFVVASYKVWAKERTKNINLGRELSQIKENPVNYDIHYNISRINLDEKFEKLKQEKSFVKGKLAVFYGEPICSPDIFSRMASFTVDLGLSKSDWEKYEKELEQYEKELISYQAKVQNTFPVELTIENIGVTFDEKINIIIEPANECEFVASDGLQKPEIPGRPISFFDGLLNPPYLRDSSLMRELSHINFDRNPNKTPFREIQRFSRSQIEVNLRELRVRQKASILYHGLFVKSNKDTIELSVEIKSKETKSPIHLRVVCEVP